MDKSEAHKFVSGKLGVDEMEEKLEAAKQAGTNRLRLLNEIVLAFHNHVPFHNLDLLSALDEQREKRLPPFEKIIESGLAGIGGQCFSNNVFMHELLKALGFSSELMLSRVGQPGSQNHVVVIISGVVSNGDMYLVDIGLGKPTFEAIPLDFADGGHSVVYNHSVQPFRYSLCGGTYIREHVMFPDWTPIYPIVKDGWNQMCFFDLKKFSYETLEQILDKAFSNPDFSFLKNLHVVRWNENKMIAIKNQTLKLENDSFKLEAVSDFETAQDMINVVTKYFPMIPNTMVENGVHYWYNNCK